VQVTVFKFGRNIHRVYPNKSPLKILVKRERGQLGISRDHPLKNFFWLPPIISCTGKAANFKFVRKNHRVHSNKSPLKFLEKRERGRIHGLPNFWVSPIISGPGKATNFKFCTHIHRINRKKCPLKISGKVRVIVRDSRK